MKRADEQAELEDGEPTEEERAAVQQAWDRGERLPFPWIVVELPKSQGKVMLKVPEVWRKRFWEEQE